MLDAHPGRVVYSERWEDVHERTANAIKTAFLNHFRLPDQRWSVYAQCHLGHYEQGPYPCNEVSLHILNFK